MNTFVNLIQYLEHPFRFKFIEIENFTGQSLGHRNEKVKEKLKLIC